MRISVKFNTQEFFFFSTVLGGKQDGGNGEGKDRIYNPSLLSPI